MATTAKRLALGGITPANGKSPDQRLPRMALGDVEEWRRSLKHIQDSHYDAAGALHWYHYATGLPLVVCSAIAASSVVSDAKVLDVFGPYATLITSTLSLLVTVLAAIQTFLGFEKRSALHYKAGAKYGAIKRQLELHQGYEDGAWLSKIADDWDKATEESPIIPLSIWERTAKRREPEDATEGAPVTHARAERS